DGFAQFLRHRHVSPPGTAFTISPIVPRTMGRPIRVLGYNVLVIRLLSCLLCSGLLLIAQKPAPFEVEETTIAQVHEAMKAGRLTCRELVGDYLRRIEAYDKNGPAINSLVVVNPEVEKQAEELDRRFAQSGLTGPLHCVPVIVKDNF